MKSFTIPQSKSQLRMPDAPTQLKEKYTPPTILRSKLLADATEMAVYMQQMDKTNQVNFMARFMTNEAIAATISVVALGLWINSKPLVRRRNEGVLQQIASSC